MTELSPDQSISNEDEIGLAEVARQLWAGRIPIMLITLFFVVLGGLYIFYKHLTVIPEYESQLTLHVDSPSPAILPVLITSTQFMNEVLAITIVHPEFQKRMTVLEALKLHRPSQGNLAGLRQRIHIHPGKAGTLEIFVSMQNPILAKIMADSIAQSLIPYLVTFHMQRAQRKLQNIANRYEVAQAAYLQSLQSLSDLSDRPGHGPRSVDSFAIKRLRAECDIKFNVYQDLAQQLEKARIDELNAVPIITILDPPSVACQSNTPETLKAILIMLFLGLILGIGFVLGKHLFVKQGEK